MSKIFPVFGWLCVLGIFNGCGKSAPPAGQRNVQQVAQAPVGQPGPGDGPATNIERKIVYTGQIEVIVDDMVKAQQRLMTMIKSVTDQGGYLARQEITGTTGTNRRASWTIRVPLAQFDSFVAMIEGLGELQRNSRDAQDVTEAYADLDARLRNKQASETRLLTHLEKTAELKETLELERELSRVRGEVEQLQGQLNLLKSKTDLATVSLSLLERDHTPVALSKPTFLSQIGRTFNTSFEGLVLVGQMAVLIAVALSPWLVAAAVLSIPVAIVRTIWLRIYVRRP